MVRRFRLSGLACSIVRPAIRRGAPWKPLAAGYRVIDTAASYLNERHVGEAIACSGIDRAETFVTTKLWLTEYGYDKALDAFDASLKKLGLDYIDFYLLHWPLSSDFEATVASYKATEKLLSEGRTRAIGVSNFSPVHPKRLMDCTEIVPALNQVELHPRFQQRELREVHKRPDILTQAWSPIGGSIRRFADQGKGSDPLKDPTIAKLAGKYGKAPAQVVLRWHPSERGVRDPQILQSGAHRRELQHLRFRALQGGHGRYRCARYGRAGRTRPGNRDRNHLQHQSGRLSCSAAMGIGPSSRFGGLTWSE